MKYLTLAVSLTLLAGPCLALDGGARPAGSGPGVFSPNSPFSPLSDRADVLPWSVLTCAFCYPGGPESMVEVRTKTPVVVEGTFAVLSDDPQGLFYRMTEVVPVK